MDTIIKTAVSAGKFKTLAKALEIAGLVEALSGTGPFTVFAPSDEAFAKIPRATLDSLLADKAQLARVLQYHVVSGSIFSKDLSKPVQPKTLEGETLSIRSEDGVMVNQAHIVQADIKCDNGVIHCIDNVLLPSWLQSKMAA